MISREKLFSMLVRISFYLALLRSTEMWFAYPTSEHHLALISFLPQKIMQIGLLAIILLLLLLSFWRKMLSEQLSKTVILLLLSIFFSILLSDNFFLSIRFFLSMLVVTLPVYFYYLQFGVKKLFSSFFFFLKALLFLNILYIFIFPQYAIMTGIHSGAFRGAFIHKNAFGSTMAIVFAFYFISWWKVGKCGVNFSFLFMVISAILIILSKSMTAILLAVLALFSVFIFSQIFSLKNRNQKHLVFLIFIIVTSFSIFLFNQYLDDFLIYIGKDPTLTGRTGLWEVLLRVGLNKPIIGHGLGLFSRPDIMYQFTEEFGWAAKSSHSSVLDVFLGVGLVGLATLTIVLFTSIWNVLFLNIENQQFKIAVVACLSILVTRIMCAFVSSGVLLSNTFDWVVIVVMVLFLKNSKTGLERS